MSDRARMSSTLSALGLGFATLTFAVATIAITGSVTAQSENVRSQPGNVSDDILLPANDDFRFGVAYGTIGSNAPECPGDADGDLDVDFDDLNLVLASWSILVIPGSNGDVNNDGFVDFDDLNIVLANWNAACN